MARTPTTEELLRELERIKQMPSLREAHPEIYKDIPVLSSVPRTFKGLDQHRRDLGYGPPFVPSINRDPRFSNIQENLGSLEDRHGIKKIVPPNGLGGKSVEQIVAEGAQPEGQTWVSGPTSQTPDTEQLTQRDAPNRLPSMTPVPRPPQIQEETFREPLPTVLSERPAITQQTERQPWDGTPYEGRSYEPDSDIKRAFMGAKDAQGRQTHRGMLEGLLSGVRGITDPIFSGAKNLFEDPTRMALLMGGLRMADPNSQYTVDKAGNEWYSPWSAPVAGLGTGIQTYKKLSEPKKLGYEREQEIAHANKMKEIAEQGKYKDPRAKDIKLFEYAKKNNQLPISKDTQMPMNFTEYQGYLRTKAAPRTTIDMREGFTHGFKKLDENFGKWMSGFIGEGGHADSLKMIGQLAGVEAELKAISEGTSNINLTGPYLGKSPESVRAHTHPESVAAQNAVEEVVQRNLKAILGAQFTQQEGERLIARAYNPQLEEGENLKRITRLLKQMRSALKMQMSAIAYFDTNGTLQGWKGTRPTKEAFDPDTLFGKDKPTKKKKKDDIPEGFEEIE